MQHSFYGKRRYYILNSCNRLLLLDSYTCPFFELCEKNAASFLLQHFHVFIIIIVVMLNIFDLPYFPWNCNNNQNITLRERKFKSMIITHEEGEREKIQCGFYQKNTFEYTMSTLRWRCWKKIVEAVEVYHRHSWYNNITIYKDCHFISTIAQSIT